MIVFQLRFWKKKTNKIFLIAIKIEVSKFPEAGRPENFSGIVGEFTLSQEISKTPQNNSYKLLININGTGDLSTLSSLNIPSMIRLVFIQKKQQVKGGKIYSQ